MKDKIIWIEREIFDGTNLAINKKVIEGHYLREGSENEIIYRFEADTLNDDKVNLKVTKVENKKVSEILNVILDKVIDNNNLMTLYTSWYKGIEWTNSEGEFIDNIFRFLFQESVFNIFINILKKRSSMPNIEHLKEVLLTILSNYYIRVGNKRRILHTKSVVEILRDSALYPVEALNTRLYDCIKAKADKDFEILEDISELQSEFFTRTLEDPKREKAEFYKVRDLETGEVTDISAFWVYSIRELDK